MTPRKQAAALCLVVLMFLCNTLGVFAQDVTAMPEFPDYTAQLYTQPYNEDNPTANLVKSGDKISKSDTLYYVIEKTEMVSEAGPSENDVQEGTTYLISLPDPLVCKETHAQYEIVAEYPREDGSTGSVSVGAFSMNEGSQNITITFDIPDTPAENPDGITLDQLMDFHLSFACKLDENALADQVDGQGQLTMVLPQNNSLVLVISEMVPAEPVAPVITKTNDGSQKEETTWTITYTPSNETYTGTKPTRLVDTLPAGLQLVDNSITITPENGASVVTTPQQLTFDITGDVPVTISYRTKFTDETWIKIFETGSWKGSFSNSVQGYYMPDDGTGTLQAWGNPITSTVNQSISSKLLSKDSSDIDFDPATNQYSATWTIAVRPQGQTFDALVLEDVMGSGLLIPQNLADLNIAIHYPDSASGAPVIAVEEENIVQQGQTLTIDLSPYLAQIGGKDFDLKYTTQVNGTAIQNPPVNLEDYKNTIQAQVQMGEKSFTTAPISYTPENVEQVLITHRGVAANVQDRTLTWETTINPDRSGSGWDLPSPNLTEIVYRDELPKAKPTENNSAWHSFGWTDEMRDATAAMVRQNIEQALRNQNLPETALQSVTITEEENNWVLEVRLLGTGDKPITFQYKTYAQDPSFWAGNKGSNYYYKNRVGLVANDTKIDGTPLGSHVFADGNITMKAATVLRKWPMNFYNPTDKTLTWELFINERAANLGEIKIEEALPAGMSYVPGSAKIGYDRNNGTLTTPLSEEQVVTTPDGTLTFLLDDVTAFCRIQFDVQVDVDQLKKTTTSFQNTAKLFVINEAEEEKPWVNTASASETAKIVNRLLTKTSGAVTGTGTNKAVTYTVKLNPLGMDLTKLVENSQDGVYLSDTLDSGLVLDMESVKLYEGVVEKTSKPNSMTHSYTPEVKQGAEISSPEISFDSWENQLRVHIPDPTKAYYLTYTAYVVAANVPLNNDITLEGSTLQSSGDQFGSAQAEVEVTVSVGIKLRPPTNKYFSVAVEKVDSADAAKLKDAEFGLYTVKGEESSIVARGTTGEDGTCVLSVPKSEIKGKDTLYIKEIAAPNDYLMDRTWHEVPVQNSTEISTISVGNEKVTKQTSGRIELTVKIEPDQPVDPWEITKFPFLVSEKPDDEGTPGEPKGPFYPDRDGKITIDGLDPEKEYIILMDEEEIPSGYEKPDPTPVKLENGLITLEIIVQPVDEEKPVDPDNPDGGNKPTDPDEGNKPTDPDNPDSGSQPTDPDEGGKPVNPDGGSQPSNPGESEKPTDPGAGNQPTDPGTGNQPANPGTGDQPTQSNNSNSVIVQTGDQEQMQLWLACGVLSLFGVLCLLYDKNKKLKFKN